MPSTNNVSNQVTTNIVPVQGTFDQNGNVINLIGPAGKPFTAPTVSNVAVLSLDANGNPIGIVNPKGGLDLPVSQSFNIFPHISLARGVVNTFKTALGANADATQLSALELALSPLMASSAWNKIKELWIPMGNGTTIAGALVKLKYPSGGSQSMTNVGFVGGDYTATTGLTGDGVGKYLNAVTNPTTIGMTGNNFGLAIYSTTPDYNSVTNTVLGGLTSGTTYGYLGASNLSQKCNFNGISTGADGTWGRMTFCQSNASLGLLQYGVGADVMATAPLGASFLPNVPVFLFAHNNAGPANFTSSAINGYALFDTMTVAELDMLSRFFDQINYSLSRPVFNGLVSAGDSITIGNGVTSVQRWTYLVAQALGLTEYNKGISSTTMSLCPTIGDGGVANVNAKWSPTVSSVNSGVTNGLIYSQLQYPGSLYTIALGINDCAYSGNLSQFSTDYTSYLTHLKYAGIPMSSVVLVAITYGTESLSPGVSQLNENSRLSFNGVISALATTFGCIFADVSSLWNVSNVGTYTGDGLHPNIAGHQLMASTILNSIYSGYKQLSPSFVGLTSLNK